MNQLIKIISQSVLKQLESNKSNIVRIEGIDNPAIYKGLCEQIKLSGRIDRFIPKITREKYYAFQNANRSEWIAALSYLHQGDNETYSQTISDAYTERSYVDFNNAITKWRNESANTQSTITTLILLMGTEDAPDTGGLADTSFVISPQEIIADLEKDYSAWFTDVIEHNSITEEYKKSIHTLYRVLFSHLTTDIFRLSEFVDGLFDLEFFSVQEIVSYICETLSIVWELPSIISKKAVPKVSALSKGTLNGAKIISSAIKFINRSDDIPSAAALKKMHKKFDKYAENHEIDPDKPFPEESQVFTDYRSFEDTVVDFMCGIDIDGNRDKLLHLDYAILYEIVGTKLPVEPKEKAPTFAGSPVEVYSNMFLDAMKSFYSAYKCYPVKLSVGIIRISLSDCTDDQKEDSFMNICNFVGGILHFFNEIAVEIDGELLQVEYTSMNCDDPFDFANYNQVSDRIKSTGKWGDPCKIQFIVQATNGDMMHKYEYKWAFSPYSPWLNAFSYLADALHSSDLTYALPTLVSCANMQDYIDCESEEEFYAHLQQFRGNVLFERHRDEIRQYFQGKVSDQFDLVCNDFKNFALRLTQHGFFNAGNELRKLVQSYTDIMQTVHDNYGNFTDIQKEKLPLIINCFTITANAGIMHNSDVISVIVPAYNPIMLEKIDAQQLFLRQGFDEISKKLMAGKCADNTLGAKFDNLVQLSSITQAADAIQRKATEYLICKNMWEYFGVYFGESQGNDLLSSNAVGLSIVTDDEDASAMLQNTPMSNVIVRNVLDYVRTFPARVDGLNIAFIAPTDMQHIVSAVHSIAKVLDNEDSPATINIKLICLNSKKNAATYLRRWLDSYFSNDKAVKVNTYLHNSTVRTKSDIDELKELLENYDLCFTYNILQSAGIQFDVAEGDNLDINYEKFPMTFTPDTIPATHGKARRVNISQFQFYAAKQHTQASHIAGYPHSRNGTYRVYRTLEMPEIQEAIIEIAHRCCKWVVCIDQAIDRHMLESADSKIIGFTTGEGSYGELNVTVSARKDVLKDIKQMFHRRITEKFANWDSKRLQKAADYCVDELSQYMDGSRILKALNPYDYEIHSFLAYILTIQMLGLTKNSSEHIVRALISLDSYKHWFSEDNELSLDNKRPDFMFIEIPYSEENITPGEKLRIKAKIIECKMGYQNENRIVEAKSQLEKGLITMGMNWRADATGVMHRYWLNQLYRAIIFSPLSMDNTSREYKIVREKIYEILNGKYEIEWTGDIFAFWLDANDTQEEWDIYSTVPEALAEENVIVREMKCHKCGQMFIQKMLLPEDERDSQFDYNAITAPEEDTEEEVEPDLPEVKVTSGAGDSIPKTKEIYLPFLQHLSDLMDHTRKECLSWCQSYFSITDADQKLIYKSNGHLIWETAFDFAITDFRKHGLLENSKVGVFRITELGKRAEKAVENGADVSDFFALVDSVKNKPVQQSGTVVTEQNSSEESSVTGDSNGDRQDHGEQNDRDKPSAGNQGGSNLVALEDIRVLIGKNKISTNVYWEFGHKLLGNRHVLITGSSGQGKTYSIQTMLLELARQNISSVIFDYTDGFMPNKLEPEFVQELGDRIDQRVALIHKIPVNPFLLQETEIPPFGRFPESSANVAGRLADILKHVYGFGDQQRAAIYSACKDGIDKYKDQMSFARLRELLEESTAKEAKTVLSKMAQFFDQDLFDTDGSFDWKSVTARDGKVTVIQLTNLDRSLQTVITEITLWDAWYSLTKFGNKDTPFVVVLDEAQNLSFQKESPAEKILREGRKYGWSAWFATQFLKGALDSGEISNLQQAAERLYFKPSGEEMAYVAGQIADDKSDVAEWLNTVKNLQKGQCIVQGDRTKPNGHFGAVKPALVNVSSFGDRQ